MEKELGRQTTVQKNKISRLQGSSWRDHNCRLSEELREPFLDAIVDTYLQKVPIDEQGKTHVKMVRLEVEAQKR